MVVDTIEYEIKIDSSVIRDSILEIVTVLRKYDISPEDAIQISTSLTNMISQAKETKRHD